MALKLSLQRRCLQLQSTLKHGGASRALGILAERQQRGFSTLSLSYSWPKQVFLHPRLTKERSCHFLIPHLMEAGAFGGIATLCKLVVEFAAQYDRSFVYLTDYPGTLATLKKLSAAGEEEWKKVADKIQIIDCSVSSFINLVANVHEDHFVATAWWTKASLDELKDQLQSSQITYVIQDDESLFYDAHDPVEKELRKLALATYRGKYRAIVNSQFLADYLKQKNLIPGAGEVRVLEPQIREDLFFPRLEKQERILWVYSRPDVRRNRFDLCVKALRLAAQNANFADWKILGAGTLKKKVFIAPGLYLEPLGKLSLEAYAQLAQRSAVALCLMESPHPSYPPLELARAGARVVCNRFANKDYSQLGPQYLCRDLNAAALADAIIEAVSGAEEDFARRKPIR